VRLALTDEGIGLPATEIPRVFEKYYRVRTGAAHARTGSGLGLSIVAHAMAAHGGRVDVVSAVGQGSTFTLIFPAEMPCPAS
jgi:two-component system sensor histidine kinase SenX3